MHCSLPLPPSLPLVPEGLAEAKPAGYVLQYSPKFDEAVHRQTAYMQQGPSGSWSLVCQGTISWVAQQTGVSAQNNLQGLTMLTSAPGFTILSGISEPAIMFEQQYGF